MPTNEELFLAGDITGLYSNNVGYMHALCNRFLSTGIEYDDLLGLYDVAFTQAYKSFDPSKSVWLTYLTKVMQNRVLKEVEKVNAKKRRAIVTSYNVKAPNALDENATLADLIPSSEDLESEVLLNAEVEALKSAIGKLPKIYRDTISLVLQERTQYQIAAELGVSQAAVNRRIRKSHALLRTIMKGEERLG